MIKSAKSTTKTLKTRFRARKTQDRAGNVSAFSKNSPHF
jgi:hypothetical protein